MIFMHMIKLIAKKAKNNSIYNLIRLIDINKNQEIWFQCLHSYSVFYKSPIQIINNQFIIERLTPQDACLVGVICGERYNELLNNKIIINSVNESSKGDFHVDKCKFIAIHR